MPLLQKEKRMSSKMSVAANGLLNSPTSDEIKNAMREARKIASKRDMAICQANLDSFSDLCGECGHRARFETGRVFVCAHRWELLKGHAEFSLNPMNPSATTVIVERPK